MFDLTYARAIANADHLIALGDTTIYLRDDKDFPWSKATDVTTGSSYRLSGPTSIYVIAEDSGLTFRLSVDFESRDANGRGVSLFDRDKLRDLTSRLPAPARKKFADLLASEVIGPLETRANEIRQALNEQQDSLDCVRGLIAFASAIEAPSGDETGTGSTEGESATGEAGDAQ